VVEGDFKGLPGEVIEARGDFVTIKLDMYGVNTKIDLPARYCKPGE